MKNPWEWDRSDLENLIGQSESLRLEFKSSAIFDKSLNDLVKTLSKEVSAFANTEGGVLVIGVEEGRQAETRVATGISGVDAKTWRPERLQQIIDSNISPPLPGIRVRPIYLDDTYQTCVYVVSIPQGTTAYQAKDHLYYGRSEYECKSLADHEIRMRMFRGKVPSGILTIQDLSFRTETIKLPPTGSPIHTRGRIENSYIVSNTEGKETTAEVYFFELFLENIGEVNIKSFKCKIEFDISSQLRNFLYKKNHDLIPSSIAFQDDWMLQERDILWRQSYKNKIKKEKPSFKVNVYPGDTFHVQSYFFSLKEDVPLLEEDLILKWTLYLEDKAPSQGYIDIASEFLRTEQTVETD